MGDARRPPRQARRSRRRAAPMPEAFRLTVEDHPDRVAVRTKDDEVSLTWAQLRDRVDALAGGLAGLGVRRGDTVALMLGNRPEFHVADLAAMTLGATPFSIYQTFTPAADRVTSSATRARSWRSSRRRTWSAFLAARAELPELETVIVVEGARGEGTVGWDEVEGADPDFDPEPHWRAVEPEDVLTLIYTSGTTGPPKGVQLVHRNLMAAVSGRRRRDPVPRRREGHLVAAGGAHRRAQRAPLPADRVRDDGHDLPEPARDRRLPAGRQADLVLRRAAHLREAQGGPRGPSLDAGRADRRLAHGRAAQGRARAGRRAGARRRRRDRRGGRGAAVRRAARDARARRGDRGQRRRGADAARRARLLPRDRHPARRAVGHVGDLRRRRGQPARAGPDRHRRAAVARASRCGSPTTASCWCAATS